MSAFAGAVRRTLALFAFDPLGMVAVVAARLLFDSAEAAARVRRIVNRYEGGEMPATATRPVVDELDEGEQRECLLCGCTDEHACPGGCGWVSGRLCTACLERGAVESAVVALLELIGPDPESCTDCEELALLVPPARCRVHDRDYAEVFAVRDTDDARRI